MDERPSPSEPQEQRPLTEEEENLQRLALVLQKRPLVVYGLILAFFFLLFKISQISGISLVNYFWPQEDTVDAVLELGGMRPLLVSQGDYWRLFAAIFLHHGLVHLIANSIGLYNLGTLIENLYGRRNFILLFLLSGISGCLLSWLADPSSFKVAAGASGALFGLIGAGLVFSIQYHKKLPPGVGSYLFKNLAFWTVLWLFIGYTVPQIDNLGHLGGLMGGLILGPLFYPRGWMEGERMGHKAFAGVSLLALVIFLVAAFWPNPKPPVPYQNQWFKFKHPPYWTFEKENQKGTFSLLRQGERVIYFRVGPRSDREDVTSFVDKLFEVREKQYRDKNFYKIPREDRYFLYLPREGPSEKLLGKRLGYSYLHPQAGWITRTIEVLFIEDLVFLFEYERLDRDKKKGEKIFEEIQKSLVILKTHWEEGDFKN